MDKWEPNGVQWHIVDGAEDVIEVEGMVVLMVVKEVNGKDGECQGCRVDIAVGDGRDDYV